MNGKKSHVRWSMPLFLLLAIILLASCGQQETHDVPVNALRPDGFKYGYDGQFGRYNVADTAEAYIGDPSVSNGNAVLIGKATAIELQESASGGPKVLKIEVAHLSSSGETMYRGYVYIQVGPRGGTLIKEEDISGNKSATYFDYWPFGD